MRFLTGLLSILFLFTGASFAQETLPDATTYVEMSVPNGELRASPDSLSDELRSTLIRRLFSLGVDQENTPIATKAKALGILLALDPKHEDGIRANNLLKKGIIPSPPENPYGTKTVAVGLRANANSLAKEGSPRLALYLFDLILEIDPADEDAIYGVEILKKKDARPLYGRKEGSAPGMKNDDEPFFKPAEKRSWWIAPNMPIQPFSGNYLPSTGADASKATRLLGEALLAIAELPVQVEVTAAARLQSLHIGQWLGEPIAYLHARDVAQSRRAASTATPAEVAENLLSALRLLKEEGANAEGIARADRKRMFVCGSSVFCRLLSPEYLPFEEKGGAGIEPPASLSNEEHNSLSKISREADWALLGLDGAKMYEQENRLSMMRKAGWQFTPPAEGAEAPLLAHTTSLLVTEIRKDRTPRTRANGLYIQAAPVAGISFEGGEEAGVSQLLTEFFTRERGENSLTTEGRLLRFRDPFLPGDLPAATLSSALLIHASLRDIELDPRLAAIADLNHTGKILLIPATAERLSSAFTSGSDLVLIPWENREDVLAYKEEWGLDRLLKMQVLGVETFSEAEALAQIKRPAEIGSAIDAYRKLGSIKMAEFRTDENIAELERILEVLPKHISARLVLSAVKR